MTQTQEQGKNITPEQKENYADELLTFMKNELEKEGYSYKTTPFDFHLAYTQKYLNAEDEYFEEGKELTKFKNLTQIDDEVFQIIIKYCLANQYLKKLYLGEKPFDNIILTDSGFARATSVIRAKYRKPLTDSNTPNIHIGSITSDSVQIGNNNVQNIQNSFKYLIDSINAADATIEEKNNTLKKMQEFIYSPIVSNILSSGVVETIKRLIGA